VIRSARLTPLGDNTPKGAVPKWILNITYLFAVTGSAFWSLFKKLIKFFEYNPKIFTK